MLDSKKGKNTRWPSLSSSNVVLRIELYNLFFNQNASINNSVQQIIISLFNIGEQQECNDTLCHTVSSHRLLLKSTLDGTANDVSASPFLGLVFHKDFQRISNVMQDMILNTIQESRHSRSHILRNANAGDTVTFKSSTRKVLNEK